MKLRPSTVLLFLKRLKDTVHGMAEPLLVKLDQEYNRDPYIILIGCLLSLRTRDTVTYPVCKKLFAVVRTPQQMVDFPDQKLYEIIRPVNYYLNKGRTLKSVSRELIERFNGHVPKTESELLSLKGVGRKTANLVLAEAFGIPALGVDTHVHRLANELGLVTTKTPYETECALKKIIPQSHWAETHRLLVKCGQNKCNIKPLLKVLHSKS